MGQSMKACIARDGRGSAPRGSKVQGVGKETSACETRRRARTHSRSQRARIMRIIDRGRPGAWAKAKEPPEVSAARTRALSREEPTSIAAKGRSASPRGATRVPQDRATRQSPRTSKRCHDPGGFSQDRTGEIAPASQATLGASSRRRRGTQQSAVGGMEDDVAPMEDPRIGANTVRT
jgi:hypothetical protein